MVDKAGIEDCPISLDAWVSLLRSEITSKQSIVRWSATAIITFVGGLMTGLFAQHEPVDYVLSSVGIVIVIGLIGFSWIIRKPQKSITERQHLIDDIVHGHIKTPNNVRLEYCRIRGKK